MREQKEKYKRDHWTVEENRGKHPKRKAPKKPKYGIKKEVEEELYGYLYEQ